MRITCNKKINVMRFYKKNDDKYHSNKNKSYGDFVWKADVIIEIHSV